MFTSKEIKTIQNQNAALHQQRQGRAEACFQTGMAALAQAHAQGFANPLTARKACESFIEAIRQKRSEVRPYLMLAYLFAVYDAYPTAWQYLKAAQDIAPAHPEVAHFRQHLQSVGLASAVAESQETQQDQEYQALETRLRRRIQSLERQDDAEVTADPVQLTVLLENSKRFQEDLQSLGSRIEALSGSFDTGALNKLLEQLSSLWRPYDAALRNSRVLTALKAEVQQTQLKVLELLQQCARARSADMPGFEAALDALLDRCDAYNDALETLAKRDVWIQEVEAIYHNLLGQAELFRELIDERLADLAGQN